MFSHVDTARLTMRFLSDRFIDAYLDEAGDSISTTVGGYQLEKLGIQFRVPLAFDLVRIQGLTQVEATELQIVSTKTVPVAPS